MEAVETYANTRWGRWDILDVVPSLYKVKRLIINPGESISLQFHKHRSETWIIVQGSANVLKGDILFKANVGDHFHIPQLLQHKVTCTSPLPLIAIEVQLGKTLDETDIIRKDYIANPI